LTSRARCQGHRWPTYGSGRRARIREAVSHDLGRAIGIERWRSTLGGFMAAGGPLLLTVVRLPELGRVWATAVPGSPGLARNDKEGLANTLRGLRP
jgi:hypothetical protein